MKKTIYSSLAICLTLTTPLFMTETMAETTVISTTIRIDHHLNSPPKKQIPMRVKYTDQSKQADLVITEIKKMGKVKTSRKQNISIPIRITIKNRGSRTARKFKVATEVFNPSLKNYSFIKFHAPGYSSSRPTVKVNLAPGKSTSIYGNLYFSKNFRGRNVRVRAKADDCRGAGFSKSPCRVRESNERNNYSGNARIIIPR